MTNLSPAAQAVLDAAINVAESPDAEAIVSAAIRELADQVVPDEGNFLTPAIVANIRAHILAIATELEGRP